MSILREAEEIVNGARQDEYGHPLDNWELTARLWEPVLGVKISAEQAATCMVLLKAARLAHAYKRDSVVDIAGYAAIISMIHEERAARQKRKSRFVTVCEDCGSPADPDNHACGDGS